jgi:hypothetical protein
MKSTTPPNHPPEVLKAARLLGPALGRKASDPGTLRLAAAVLDTPPRMRKVAFQLMVISDPRPMPDRRDPWPDAQTLADL